jgi:hypothetical protein
MDKDITDLYLYPSDRTTEKSKGADETAQFVKQRFAKMSYAKTAIRQVWQGTQYLYYPNEWEWIVRGEDFSAPVRLPTLRDLIKSLTDVFMQNPPKATMTAKNEEENVYVIGKKAYIDSRVSSIHEKSVRRQVIEDMFFFGKGFREITLNKNSKTKGKNIIVRSDDIASQRIDPRNMFVDENARKINDLLRIEGARDVIIRHFIPLSTLKKMAKKNGWDVDGVIAQPFFQIDGYDFMPTNDRETLEKSPVYGVKMYEYMNQEDNMYALIINDKTIFETTLEAAKGTDRIPVVDYSYELRNDSFWGNTFPQIIAPHIYLKDTIFNLEILNLKLTLQPVLAVSGDFGYNKKTHVIQPGGVWQSQGFDQGKVGDKITPIIAGNTNTHVYDMMSMLSSEISVTARTDVRNLNVSEAQTATQANLANQSQNSHNFNMESVNEIEAEAVMYEIMMDIMKEFMDEKMEDGKKRRIKIKGYNVNRNEGEVMGFEEESGAQDFFDLTQKMIDVDCEVTVEDARGKAQADQIKIGRIMQVLPIIGNIAMMSPEVLQKVDLVGMLEEFVELIGMDPESAFKRDRERQDELEITQEEIQLGHKIDVPEDETRKESLARYKYFTKLRKRYIDKPDVLSALDYHLNSTMQNIVANHIEKMKMAEAKKQSADAQMVQQTMGQQGGQPVPSQGQGGGNPGAIPQAASGVTLNQQQTQGIPVPTNNMQL